MREIARSITVNIQKRRVTMKALSWQEHLAQGHVPFRKDCAVCQRAAARDRPHRAQGIAAPCVLSLDLTGPFVLGHDIDITFLKQGDAGTTRILWPMTVASAQAMFSWHDLVAGTA